MLRSVLLSRCGPGTAHDRRARPSRSALRVEARDTTRQAPEYRVRKGVQADLAEIVNLVVNERMNPLGLEPSRFKVAISVKDGKLLGCVQVEPKPHPERIRYYELRTMVVDPGFRNLGIGKSLLDAAIATVPQDADVWATTIPASASFFARHGFDIVREDMRDVPNEIYVEWTVGRVVARVAANTTCLIIRREKKPIELPKYF